MKHSTVKFYAAGVCLITGICIATAGSKALWNGVQSYLNRAQETDLYQYYLASGTSVCTQCALAADTSISLKPPSPALTNYGRDIPSPTLAQPVAAQDAAADSPWGWLMRLALVFTAGTVFLIHWRLFRNISAVKE